MIDRVRQALSSFRPVRRMVGRAGSMYTMNLKHLWESDVREPVLGIIVKPPYDYLLVNRGSREKLFVKVTEEQFSLGHWGSIPERFGRNRCCQIGPLRATQRRGGRVSPRFLEL